MTSKFLHFLVAALALNTSPAFSSSGDAPIIYSRVGSVPTGSSFVGIDNTTEIHVATLDKKHGVKIGMNIKEIDLTKGGDAPIIYSKVDHLTTVTFYGENGKRCSVFNWASLGDSSVAYYEERIYGFNLRAKNSDSSTNINASFDDQVIALVLDTSGDKFDAVVNIKTKCSESTKEFK